MPYVTSEQILKDAQSGGYAVGAFNIENMEMAMAVISAGEDTKSPVIIQTTPSTVKYASLDLFYANVHTLAEKATIPVALHLDHGSSFELAQAAVKAGYSSVMIDGSHEKFEDNIAITRKTVLFASEAGVPVEAELGKVGGKEDDTDGGNGGYTDPEDAVKFVAETNISSLAVAIGTAHGVYKGIPVLDVDRLSAIRKLLEQNNLLIPLVLHGASGLSAESVKECVWRGICKVNFATELRMAYTAGIKQLLLSSPDVYDPKKLGAAAMAEVKNTVVSRMKICGCVGRGR